MPSRVAFDVASVNRESQNGGSYAARLMRHPLKIGGAKAACFFAIHDRYDYRLEKHEVNCFFFAENFSVIEDYGFWLPVFYK